MNLYIDELYMGHKSCEDLKTSDQIENWQKSYISVDIAV